MNIFFLNINPKICAMMHLDKHVIKMILETAQMLCAAWHVLDPEYKIYKPVYKLAHKNHPCTKWTRFSKSNYLWLCELGKELCSEYTYRYGKIHKSEKIIYELNDNIPPIPELGFTTPAQAMPDIYKGGPNDYIEAYQQYYFFEKMNFHSWKGKIAGREKPFWIKELYDMFIE